MIIYPRLTKFYQITQNFDIECLTLVKQVGKECLLQTGDGKDVRLKLTSVNKLNMSRVIVLTELEEILRNKIEVVHKGLREHKQNINPIDLPMVTYIMPNIREVHQYNLNTGSYIQSFNSVKEAIISVGGNPLYSGLHKTCKGLSRYYSYKGFRWSYEKVKKLT